MGESITVSALNFYARTLIESDEVLSQIWVEGEIGSLKIHRASGHMYFRLCDSEASVAAVMFAGHANRLRFVPKDGMYVVARCKVSLYERDGAFQLYVEDLIPKGIGSAAQELEALKRKLQKEGLFDAQRKRPLPRFPKQVAVVTSADGAALHDILNVTRRRWPFVKLVLFPVAVQGRLAAATLVDALCALMTQPNMDAAIIARGGGSKEDLSCFNEEEVVRAASQLPMPFISAVGHEIDYTLLDFAADVRAATPSAAAEMLFPDARELLSSMQATLQYAKERVQARVVLAQAQLEDMKGIISDGVMQSLNTKSTELQNRYELLCSLDPAKVLERGYAGVWREGVNISRAAQLQTGDSVLVRFTDGEAQCTVQNVDTTRTI